MVLNHAIKRNGLELKQLNNMATVEEIKIAIKKLHENAIPLDDRTIYIEGVNINEFSNKDLEALIIDNKNFTS